MRESANGFLLNGATVQESGFSGTAIIPNLDSIAEFRILTNNFDAEYGAYAVSTLLMTVAVLVLVVQVVLDARRARAAE